MNNTIILNLVFLWILSTGLKAQTVKDIDGNTYSTIRYGSNVWMAEPLKTTRLNDGTAIPLIEYGDTWEKTNEPAYCWLYNDEIKNKEIGAIYNWYTVETGKLCPTGWHVPTDRIFLDEAQWPGGGRSYSGWFSYGFSAATYWTSTEETFTTAYCTTVLFDSNRVSRSWSLKNSGYLVRCVKNKN